MTIPAKRQRRILRNVEFVEFSAVDFPAHEGARAVMQKRAAILSTTPTSEQPPKEIPTMSDLATVQAALTKAQADITALTADRDAVAKQAAYLEKVAALSDAERAHLATLDAADRPAWVGKSKAARSTDLAAALENDPVVETLEDGTEIRKSAGPVALGIARQNKFLRDELSKQRTVAERTRLEKRAETELGKAGGTLDGKVALLKAVEAISDEPTRKAAGEVLTAMANTAKVVFSTKGSSEGSTSGGDHEMVIQRKAEAYAKAKGVPVAKAWGVIMDPRHEDADAEAIAAYEAAEAERRGNR
jgi:hypothetical protein